LAGHPIDKASFLALEDMADNLPGLREYVGEPQQPYFDDEDHRFHVDCRVSMAPDQAREYKQLEEILVGGTDQEYGFSRTFDDPALPTDTAILHPEGRVPSSRSFRRPDDGGQALRSAPQ
jgi:hypothetical protein